MIHSEPAFVGHVDALVSIPCILDAADVGVSRPFSHGLNAGTLELLTFPTWLNATAVIPLINARAWLVSLVVLVLIKFN